MVKFFRDLETVMVFSGVYYLFSQACTRIFCAPILGLWLELEGVANLDIFSQVTLKKTLSSVRHWFSFVLDLPIRLMKITFTMNKSALYDQIRRNGRWLFVSSLLISLVLWLGLLYSPAAAQTQNGFSQPVSGDVLSGIVIVQGTATDSSFLRYELAFRHESGPNSDWIVFAQGDQAVIDGTLAVWDTSVGSANNRVFPDGRYQLRLRVVRQDFNYDEYFAVDLTIANDSGTPTATPTLTTTGTTESVTPQPGESTLPELTAQAPNILPSLTPFPTPSPQATPVNESLGPSGEGSSGEVEERQGVFEQIGQIDTGRFEEAFWKGVRIVAIGFLILAAYLIFRAIFRRLWRLLANKYLR